MSERLIEILENVINAAKKGHDYERRLGKPVTYENGTGTVTRVPCLRCKAIVEAEELLKELKGPSCPTKQKSV